MRRVQVYRVLRDINITFPMTREIPQRYMTDLYRGWYATAQKIMPELIPMISQASKEGRPYPDKDGILWRLTRDPEVTELFIKYTLEPSNWLELGLDPTDQYDIITIVITRKT